MKGQATRRQGPFPKTACCRLHTRNGKRQEAKLALTTLRAQVAARGNRINLIFPPGLLPRRWRVKSEFNTEEAAAMMRRLFSPRGALAVTDLGPFERRANRFFERALAIKEKAARPRASQPVTSLNNLALLLQNQGDLAAARPLYERALAIHEKAHRSEHPSTNRTRCHLARLLITSGHATEALGLAETALRAHEKVLGPNHRWTKDAACVTAEALDALGRADQAAALRVRYEM